MKKQKLVLNLLYLYLVVVFFYGIIIKLTIENSIIFSIKTYIPELILFVVTIVCILINKLRLKKWLLFGAAYFLVVISIGCFFAKNILGSLYVFRDFFLSVYAFIFLCSIEFDEQLKAIFLKRVIVLCKLFLITGCILGIVQVVHGWSWTAEFYTGYSFYGTDPYSSVKITEYLGRVRAPGLTGNFVTFSYYGLVSCIFVVFSKQTVKWKKLFYFLTQIVILFATLNKTAIAVYCAVVLFYLFRKSNKTVRLFFAFFAFFAVTYIFLSDINEAVLFSTFERFSNWKSLAKEVNWYEIIIPINALNYNPLAEGVVSFWDNTYLYLLFSQGIIGTIWIIYAAYFSYKKNTTVYSDMKIIFELLFVFFILASFFNNITNGRSFFHIYLLINGVFLKNHRLHIRQIN